MTGCQCLPLSAPRGPDPSSPQAATHTGKAQPLINTLPDSPRSSHHPPGARSAPHHCRQYVTFSAMGRGWERGKREKVKRSRRKKKRGKGRKREKTSISSLDLKNHNISKAREPPVGSANETKILSPGDILKRESERVCCGKRGSVRGFVCVCVCVCTRVPVWLGWIGVLGYNSKSPSFTLINKKCRMADRSTRQRQGAY